MHTVPCRQKKKFLQFFFLQLFIKIFAVKVKLVSCKFKMPVSLQSDEYFVSNNKNNKSVSFSDYQSESRPLEI